MRNTKNNADIPFFDFTKLEREDDLLDVLRTLSRSQQELVETVKQLRSDVARLTRGEPLVGESAPQVLQ